MQLDRGKRMVELLKQPQYQPMSAIDQVMSIFAGTEGFLDDIPIRDVPRFEKSFLTYISDSRPEIRAALDRDKKLTDAIAADLKSALSEFKTHHFRSGAAASTSAQPAVGAKA
jgi:F-type H+-transporting ATPase subunit alpha